MDTKLSPSEFEGLGDLRWGTHFCLFYETRDDLLDILIPFFKEGLENHESCLYVASEPLAAEDAQRMMRKAIPDFERYLADGQFEIIRHPAWYLKNGRFEEGQVRQGWVDKLDQALRTGFSGLRFAVNIVLDKTDLASFAQYEGRLDETVRDLRIKGLCAYDLNRYPAATLLDMIRHHQFTIARQGGTWEHIQGSELKRANEEILRLNASLEQRVAERTAELTAVNEQLRREMAERQRAEDNLRNQTEILEKIVDHIPVMINFTSEDGRIQLVNREWERVLGWTLEEIGQENLDIFALCYPDPQYRQHVLNFIASATGEWADFKTRVRDGQIIDTTWAEVKLSDGTTIGFGMDITGRKKSEAERERLFAELYQSHEQMKALSGRLVEAEESERKRLAREIHDEIGQALTALMMQLGTARSKLPKSAKSVGSILEETEALTQSTLEQTRQLMASLRPSILDDLGLVPALRRLGDELQKTTGAEVTVKVTGLPKRLPPQIEVALFRIAQEALTNIQRHAQASQVTIEMAKETGRIGLSVQDNGIGFVQQRVSPGHFGLIGIHERVNLLEGRFEVRSAPNEGTTIRVELPL